jgi:hypothetical protein
MALSERYQLLNKFAMHRNSNYLDIGYQGALAVIAVIAMSFYHCKRKSNWPSLNACVNKTGTGMHACGDKSTSSKWSPWILYITPCLFLIVS